MSSTAIKVRCEKCGRKLDHTISRLEIDEILWALCSDCYGNYLQRKDETRTENSTKQGVVKWKF